MIDLHCHILPGVDDGAGSLEESCRMARLAWESGIRAVVATPHCGRPDMPGNYLSGALLRQVELLQTAVAERGMGLKIYPGMEVFVTAAFPRLLEQKLLLPLAGSRYLLMEFSFDEAPEFMTKMLAYALRQGLVPLVAHPERYYAVQWEPEVAARWVAAGCRLQLNRGSLQGRLGDRAQHCGWQLLRMGLGHVVASDAHGAEARRPELRSCLEALAEELGWGTAAMLLTENPRRILWNQTLLDGVSLPD